MDSTYDMYFFSLTNLLAFFKKTLTFFKKTKAPQVPKEKIIAVQNIFESFKGAHIILTKAKEVHDKFETFNSSSVVMLRSLMRHSPTDCSEPLIQALDVFEMNYKQQLEQQLPTFDDIHEFESISGCPPNIKRNIEKTRKFYYDLKPALDKFNKHANELNLMNQYIKKNIINENLAAECKNRTTLVDDAAKEVLLIADKIILNVSEVLGHIHSDAKSKVLEF